MTCEWADTLVATDASGSYGFGVSAAKSDPHLVRRFGHVAERPNQYVRLLREGPDADPMKPRKRYSTHDSFE